MTKSFVPAWWLSNTHVQTLWPSLFRKPIELARQRQRFETPDNDFFDVDWYGNGDKGIVMLVHGLTGSSSSHYILGMQQALAEQGYTTAALNCRACSGEPNLKAGSYHAGFTQDIHQLYQAIHAKHPDTLIYSVGFSLGGNSMLKWLAEQAEHLDIQAAVAVSVPYKLANCADRVDQGFSKVYRYHLISEMKSKLANKLAFFEAHAMQLEVDKLKALGDITWIKSFWEFDHHVVAKLHGFKDVHDYYQQCSSIGYLKNINIPTLLIHAEDDPFTFPSVLPTKNELSESIQLLTTPNGGHVGFIDVSAQGKQSFWLEHVISSYIKSGLRL
ncbi:MAG: hydrolase [Piscirickettsiaceae bacterium]|nr:MAG: hydrolase [Piscirickettsiaceae bacterium]